MEKLEKRIQIDLNIKPTKDFAQKLVITLLEYLLQCRNQIPFPFELFKNFIETKIISVDGSDKASKKPTDWRTEKQLKLAAELYKQVCQLKEVIYQTNSKYMRYV